MMPSKNESGFHPIKSIGYSYTIYNIWTNSELLSRLGFGIYKYSFISHERSDLHTEDKENMANYVEKSVQQIGFIHIIWRMDEQNSRPVRIE